MSAITRISIIMVIAGVMLKLFTTETGNIIVGFLVAIVVVAFSRLVFASKGRKVMQFCFFMMLACVALVAFRFQVIGLFTPKNVIGAAHLDIGSYRLVIDEMLIVMVAISTFLFSVCIYYATKLFEMLDNKLAILLILVFATASMFHMQASCILFIVVYYVINFMFNKAEEKL